MFHKQYYSLEEVAEKLDTDVETLLHMEYDGQVQLCYVHIPVSEDEGEELYYRVSVDEESPSYIEAIRKAFIEKFELHTNKNIDEIVSNVLSEISKCGFDCDKEAVKRETIKISKTDGYICSGICYYALRGSGDNDFYLKLCGNNDEPYFAIDEIMPFEVYTLERPFFVRVILNDNSVAIDSFITEEGDTLHDEQVAYRDSKGLVITHEELTRLQAIKAQNDGKPTIEQLQQQLDDARIKIEALKQQLAEAQEQQAEASQTDLNNLKRTVKAFIDYMAKSNTVYKHGNKPNISKIDLAICGTVHVADSTIKDVLDMCKDFEK